MPQAIVKTVSAVLHGRLGAPSRWHVFPFAVVTLFKRQVMQQSTTVIYLRCDKTTGARHPQPEGGRFLEPQQANQKNMGHFTN